MKAEAKITIKARVFRATTGRYEDLGLVREGKALVEIPDEKEREEEVKND